MTELVTSATTEFSCGDSGSVRRRARQVPCRLVAASLAVWCLFSEQRSLASAPADRPNFLIIMADDLGAKELACYGHPTHRTPNLDRLASTGIRFETCYATPVCHPTRFEIMTGQYGCHNGVLNFAGRRGGPQPKSAVEDIGANHVTFAELLKSAGYKTALAGKWQLSGSGPTLVHDSGFDEYLMWAYLHNLPPGVKHTGGWEKRDRKTARYWHPSLVNNGEYVATEADDYGPDRFTDFLIDFMRRNRNEPFLAYYPMCLTHGPFFATPDVTETAADRMTNSKRRYFAANVEYVDKLVGRLIETLEDLELRERTIVLFTGDNGTGGEGKSQPIELGARVPMIVNAPGIVEPLGSSEELVDLSDVLPTLVELAGAKLPSDRVIDGKSFAHILRGEEGESREWIFSYIADRRILRDRRWLLEDNSPRHPGRFYDCGDCRDGSQYVEVTGSDDPEVIAARARFEKIITQFPAPELAHDGPANSRKRVP